MSTVEKKFHSVKSSDAELLAVFPCFGVSFDKTADVCVNNCSIRDRCIQKIAKGGIDEAMAELGLKHPDINAIADHLQFDEGTAAVIMQVRDGKAPNTVLPPQFVDPYESEDPAMEVKTSTPESTPEEPVAEKKPKKTKAPPKKKAGDQLPIPGAESVVASGNELAKSDSLEQNTEEPQEAGATPPPVEETPDPEVPEATETAAEEDTVKKSTKKTATKKAPAKAAPKKAPPAKKSAAVKKAKPAKASGETSAFLSERLRSEFVASLKSGTTLNRQYKGQEFTLKVGDAGYVLTGGKLKSPKEFPTVYAATMAVSGSNVIPRFDDKKKQRTSAVFSTRRFWQPVKTATASKKKVAPPKTPKKKAAAKKKK